MCKTYLVDFAITIFQSYIYYNLFLLNINLHIFSHMLSYIFIHNFAPYCIVLLSNATHLFLSKLISSMHLS